MSPSHRLPMVAPSGRPRHAGKASKMVKPVGFCLLLHKTWQGLTGNKHLHSSFKLVPHAPLSPKSSQTALCLASRLPLLSSSSPPPQAGSITVVSLQ